MKQLVIFDLDGTLLNTISDLGAATNYALRTCGYPEHHLSTYPNMVGNGITRLIERALPEDLRDEDGCSGPAGFELLLAFRGGCQLRLAAGGLDNDA